MRKISNKGEVTIIMVLVISAYRIEQQNKVHFFKDFATKTTGNSFNS